MIAMLGLGFALGIVWTLCAQRVLRMHNTRVPIKIKAGGVR